MSRLGLRLLGGAAVVAVTMLGSTLPASAHVTVNPGTATAGGFAKLTFRVPNEQADASTTRLQVVLPADQPLGFVSVKPHPGWSFTVVRSPVDKPITTDDGPVTDYVSAITWTADSASSAIKPGEFDEFDVSAGPLPEADSMQFKALQTYSNGDVVRWIEDRPADGSMPEHPAPMLTLTAATTASSAPSSVTLAIALSVVALLVGLLAGAASVVGLRRKVAVTDDLPERELSQL